METQKTNEDNQVAEKIQQEFGNINCKIPFDIHVKIKNDAWLNRISIGEAVTMRLKQAYQQEKAA